MIFNMGGQLIGWGKLLRGAFVRGSYLQGFHCPDGFYPGGFCPGAFCRKAFDLEPYLVYMSLIYWNYEIVINEVELKISAANYQSKFSSDYNLVMQLQSC